MPRERLRRRLDGLLAESSVWITGSPGAGKTALIASYVEARALPALWYDVDRGDADPAVCCDYLRRAVLSFSVEVAAALPVPEPALAGSFEPFLAHFFTAFYRAIAPRRPLVFDNCHQAAGTKDFQKLLRIALREAPSDVRWLIASRTRPPPSFSHLLANGLLTVLPADELLFREDESLALQRLIASPEQPRRVEQMQQLHRLTGGWPAGLRLLMHVDGVDASMLPSTVVGTQSVLFDYFASEAFDRQPPRVQRALRRLAPLPRISPAMAESLAGDGANRMLAELHADHLFTSRHGDGNDIHYEFHPLWREFLRQRARADLPADEWRSIEDAAVELLVANGDLDTAVGLLVANAWWHRLRTLILDSAERLIARGWHRTLNAWFRAMPDDLFPTDPWLAYWRGVALASFDPAATHAHLESAYRQFVAAASGEGAYLAWIANVELICLEWADFAQLDRWLDDVDRLQNSFGPPPEHLAGRFTAALFGVLIYRRTYDPALDQVADRLLAVIAATPDANARVLLGCNLVLYYNAIVGRHLVLGHLMRMLEPPAGTALGPLAEALLWALRCMHAWSLGKMQEASLAAESGSRIAREHGLRMWDFLLTALEAYATLNNGQLVAGQAALERMRKCLDPRRQIDVAHYHYLRCFAGLLSGDFARALQHIERADAIASQFGGPHQWALTALSKAQVLHALGRSDDAWDLLREGRRMARAMRSNLLCFQADLCAAQWALETGDDERAADALQRAFANGAANHYVNHHAFDPPVMARLCAWALIRQIEVDYVPRLSRQRQLVAPAVTVENWPWPVRLYTLGRFGVVVDEQPVVTAGQQKPVELLQAVISEGGRGVSIGKLVDTLWPEAEGRGAFDATLARLRKLLGRDDAVRLEGGRLSLNSQHCWVDCWVFERLIGEAEKMAACPAEEAALTARLDRLRKLYRGDFLAREDDHPWSLRQRERLRRRWVALLMRFANACESRQQASETVRLLREATEVDPLAEPAYRALMLCLQAQGEDAEALHVYDLCRRMLLASFGVKPSAATEAIRRAIVSAAGGDSVGGSADG
ncbi:MAG: hypothetical protein JNL84_00970 [Candidatus Accumulibacter sp.]|nr:hypothetical protein [Accumulibacter sp.]